MVEYVCNPIYSREVEMGEWQIRFQASLGKVRKTLSQKQNTHKKAGRLAQVVEALGSMPTIAKSKQVNKKPQPPALAS
jgi:hypothetical protein